MTFQRLVLPSDHRWTLTAEVVDLSSDCCLCLASVADPS